MEISDRIGVDGVCGVVFSATLANAWGPKLLSVASGTRLGSGDCGDCPSLTYPEIGTACETVLCLGSLSAMNSAGSRDNAMSHGDNRGLVSSCDTMSGHDGHSNEARMSRSNSDASKRAVRGVVVEGSGNPDGDKLGLCRLGHVRSVAVFAGRIAGEVADPCRIDCAGRWPVQGWPRGFGAE